MTDLTIFNRYEWLASKYGVKFLKRTKHCIMIEDYRLIYLGHFGDYNKLVLYAMAPKDYAFVRVRYFYLVNRSNCRAYVLVWNREAM